MSMRVSRTKACVAARVNLTNFRPVERRLNLRIYFYILYFNPIKEKKKFSFLNKTVLRLINVKK